MRAAGRGALAGLIAGIVSGIALLQIGTLPATVSLVRLGPPAAGFVLYLVVAVALGAGLGILIAQQRAGAGETLYWGLIYGAIWWFIGPLTLMPVLQLGIVTWDVHSIQEAFASLVAHLVYGAVTGLALAALRPSPTPAPSRPAGVLARGALAGLVAAWFLARALAGQPGAGPVFWVGLIGGIGFAALYPRPADATGPTLIRGLAYGFVWWIAAALTILPLAHGAGLTWSVDDARAAFPTLPAYFIAGALVAVLSLWLDALARGLFSDVRGSADQEGAGTEGLRAVARGGVAGLTGGVLFAVMMTGSGMLPAVAALVGLESAGAGLIVHLAIAAVIGALYGLLFRRQSFDMGSALGWGVSYGFLWWVLGPLTLMPILSGRPPDWTPPAASALFASLVAHMAYGAVSSVVVHLLEARFSPWWIPLTAAEAARVARRKEQLLTSAPALWALVVLIALVLPVILGQ